MYTKTFLLLFIGVTLSGCYATRDSVVAITGLISVLSLVTIRLNKLLSAFSVIVERNLFIHRLKPQQPMTVNM